MAEVLCRFISTKLSGKIGKTNDELALTYQKLISEGDKIHQLGNGVPKKDSINSHQPIQDSVFQVLLSIIRNEGV